MENSYSNDFLFQPSKRQIPRNNFAKIITSRHNTHYIKEEMKCARNHSSR